MEPVFFASPPEFRAWLERNHASADELWVGFHKRATAKPSLTWPEAVDQALCFGWIDAIRKSLGESAYTIRFTRRKPGSTWSAVNIRRVEELTEQGLMQPAGLAAFEARKLENSAIYSYEEGNERELDAESEAELRANTKAWSFFTAQAPSYQRTAKHWIMRAKQETTKQRRLAQLVEDSEHERRLAQYRWNQKARQS